MTQSNSVHKLGPREKGFKKTAKHRHRKRQQVIKKLKQRWAYKLQTDND